MPSYFVSSFYSIVDTIWYFIYLSTCCFCNCFEEDEDEKIDEEL